MSLAERQAELVASLVAGAGDPPGFAADRLAATRSALLRKRAEEVARVWPELRAALGPDWSRRFAEWARDRRPAGSLQDGWSLARDIGAALPIAARVELAVRECTHRFDGTAAPKPWRTPKVRLVGGVLVTQFRGRVRVWNRDGVRPV